MTRRNYIASLSLAVLGVTVGALVAAPPNNAVNRNPAESTTTSAGQQTAWNSNDHMLASCVALENQEEVALAKWAKDKTKNKDVREFAEMLVKDHTAFLDKLKHFAPEATAADYLDHQFTDAGVNRGATNAPRAAAQPNANPNANAQRPNVIQQQAAKPQLDGRNEATIDMFALHREIAQQCLADTKKMLGDKDSDKFDDCFVGLQIAKHAAMKTKLSVLERHSSQELKDLLAAGEKTTSKHLDRAEELMKQLAKDSQSTASK